MNAFYGRTSTDDQAERQTIENQTHFARKYIDLHQLEMSEFYLDDGVSGTIPLNEREAGKRLLEDAKEGKFDTLLIFKLDRLGRSARVTLNTIYDFEALGIQIKSMTEPFDTSSPAGRFVITMLAGVADLERDTILERMWHGANRAAREGKWLGGITPFGYVVRNKYLEINYEPMENGMSEYDIIRFIFDKVGNEGWSTVMLADHLNALNIPTSYTKDQRKISVGKRTVATANLWRPSNIIRMLKNETYKGIHHYGKRSKKDREIIEREVPAIVDPDLWERTQIQLKENRIESFRNKTRDYLLQGLIRCECCGSTYFGINYTSVEKSFYNCSGKQKYRGPIGKCPSKNIPAPFVENMVWEECLRFIQNPEKALKDIKKSFSVKKSDQEKLEKEIMTLKASLSDKDREKESILDLYRKNLIRASDVEGQLLKISDEKTLLKKSIMDIEKKRKESLNELEMVQSANEYLASLQKKSINADFKAKREIVKSLVKQVRVKTNFGVRKTASIEVEYNFTGDENGNKINGVMHTDRDWSRISTENHSDRSACD